MSIRLALALQALAPQGQRDTLLYNVHLAPNGPHVSVEARITNRRGGPVTLVAPPAAPRARTDISNVTFTDERGMTLPSRMNGRSYVVEPAAPGAIRFRYRVDFRDRVAEGSTSAGFDASRLYVVSAALFVAPDPTVQRKSDEEYPVVRVVVLAPQTWQVVTGLTPVVSPLPGTQFEARDGDELFGSILVAGPDYRVYRDTAGSAAVTWAVRGQRYFTDSALGAVIRASLSGAARALGPVPSPRVTYLSEAGRKGRTSGSLHGSGTIGLVWEPGELLERSRSHDTFHETLHIWFGGAMTTERWWVEGVTDYFAARLMATWNGNPADLAALVYESYYNYLNIAHNTRLTMAQEARRGIAGDNTELLAYRKGMLAGLLLDAAIRRGSARRASLDDVARRMLGLARTRGSRTIRETELRDAVREAGGRHAEGVWDQVVAGTELVSLTAVTAALQDITGQSFEAPDRPKSRKQLVPTLAR